MKRRLTVVCILLAATGSLGGGLEEPRLFAAAANRWTRTTASWYSQRPHYCYDHAGRHRVPRVSRWTAHPHFRCGTKLQIVGAHGSVTLRVYDHGPYVKGRSLDLSRRAFATVCGSPSKGLCHASYRRAR